jgi:SAM-dependent methyltransferase
MDRARQTQQSYDRIAGRFLERTRDRSLLRPWMRRFRARLAADALVIDLGAGPCHDSAELRAMGLCVISVDRSRPMLTVGRDRFPGPRVQADLRQLPFRRRSVAGVWANASLLHLQRDELVPTLVGIREVLLPSGVLHLSLKHGAGEQLDTSKYGPEAPRWFTYWSEDEVDTALRVSGFEIVESATRSGSQDTWIMRIAYARS